MTNAPTLNPAALAREVSTLHLYIRWRVADPRWRASPSGLRDDTRRRAECGARIAATIDALGGLASLW